MKKTFALAVFVLASFVLLSSLVFASASATKSKTDTGAGLYIGKILDQSAPLPASGTAYNVDKIDELLGTSAPVITIGTQAATTGAMDLGPVLAKTTNYMKTTTSGFDTYAESRGSYVIAHTASGTLLFL